MSRCDFSLASNVLMGASVPVSKAQSDGTRVSRVGQFFAVLVVSLLFSLQSMAAPPAFQNQTSNSGQDTKSLLLAVPSGTVSGDFLIAFVGIDIKKANFKGTAGWTLLLVAVNAVNDSTSLGVYYRIANGAEASSYTFSWTGGGNTSGVTGTMLRYTGVDPDNPINAGGINNSNSGDPVAPSVTTTVVDTEILRVFSGLGDMTPVSPPSGHTESYEGVGFDRVTLSVARQTQSVVGATGTATFNVGSQNVYAATTVVLAPDPAQLEVDLGVSKTANGLVFGVGDTVTYTIVASNNGPDDATSVQVTDTLSAGLTYTSYTATAGTYNNATGLWSLGNLANAASATLMLNHTVNAGLSDGTIIINTVNINSSEIDSNVANNSDSTNITFATAQADLAVTKAADVTSVITGDLVTYTIVASNSGPDDTTNVIVQDTLPAGLTYSSFSASIGSYNSGSGQWIIGNLANTGSATLTLVATVDSGLSPDLTIINTATIRGDGLDVVSVNNSASDGIVYVTCQNGEITNIASVETVAPNLDPDPGNNSAVACTESVTRDYGDLPTSYGETSHGIIPDLYMGSAPPDTDSAMQGTDATGDDTDTGEGNFNDDDGVVFRSPGGGSRAEILADVTVVNNTGGTAYVCAWIDRWDSNAGIDGVFTAGDTQDGGNVCIDVPYIDGSPSTVTFNWSGLPPADGTTYARFRVCSIESECNEANDGLRASRDGEVEDYAVPVRFASTAVVINQVVLSNESASAFLSQVGVESMSTDILYRTLELWVPEQASAVDSIDRDAIQRAMIGYLDPDGDGRVAVLRWDTMEERGVLGFYIYRKGEDGLSHRVNNDMMPALMDAPMGGEYWLADPGAGPGETYDYFLIEQEARGTRNEYGPYRVSMPPH